MTRREALAGFLQFMAASPLLADRKYSELQDPIDSVANVFDMAKLARRKLDRLAWDYIDEGSEDEVSLRDNRDSFERIIVRPHFLENDVSKIDISTNLFGKDLSHPIFLCPTGGKNCVFPNGEEEVAYGAGLANTMLITHGGIDKVIDSGKGPKVWWQFTTAAEFRTKNQMAGFAGKLRDKGCTGISVTVDIYHVSHRERSIHNQLVRSWCSANGIPRDTKGKLAYKGDDMVWTSGDFPPPRPFPTPAWDTLQRLHEAASGMPVIVKGILTAEDTERAVTNGLSGVIVSNHGARQLDQVGSTICCAEKTEIAEASGPRARLTRHRPAPFGASLSENTVPAPTSTCCPSSCHRLSSWCPWTWYPFSCRRPSSSCPWTWCPSSCRRPSSWHPGRRQRGRAPG